jgi:hypothetical protein
VDPALPLTPIRTDINAHFCLFIWSQPLVAEGAVVFDKACELGLERHRV